MGRYVTADELASLSAFMTQRLTLDKVNAAVDDAAALAEGCARLLAAARSQGRLAPAERKRAQMLLVNVAVRDPLSLSCAIIETLLPAGMAGAGQARACADVARQRGRAAISFSFFPRLPSRTGTTCF